MDTKTKVVKGRYSLDGNDYYLDPLAKNLLDFVKKDLRDNWDAWYIYTGREGCGKSTLAMQHAQYVTGGKLEIQDICFTPDQLIKRVTEQQKFKAVIFDEAVTGYLSETGMSKIGAELTKLAAQCRSRNLFVSICIPSFFDLKKYIALHRSDALWHVEAPADDKGKRQRGTYFYFNKKQKQKLYLQGKKTYIMDKRFSTPGRFTNWTNIDLKDYENKKQEALKELGLGKLSNHKDQRDNLMLALEQKGETQRSIAKICGIDQTTVYDILQKFKKLNSTDRENDYKEQSEKKLILPSIA